MTHHTIHRATKTALAAAAVLAATACVPGAATPTASPASSATHSPAAAGGGTAAADLLAALQVGPEDTGAHYDRADWGDWISSGGCSTREALLRDQGVGEVQDARCVSTCPATVAPCWTSPYDGLITRKPADLQADHVVPIKQANVSGARSWSKQQRVTFYNDHDNLIMASVHSNTSKSDSDPAKWRPEQGQCQYSIRYVTIKSRYQLSIDADEKAALAAMLRSCRAGD